MENNRLAYFGCIDKAKYEFKVIFGTFSDEEKNKLTHFLRRKCVRYYRFYHDKKLTRCGFTFYLSNKSSRIKNGISALIADESMVWYDSDFEKVIEENPIIRENFD